MSIATSTITPTPCGPVPGNGLVETHANGTLRSCTPVAPCTLKTPLGELPPQHSTDDLRRKTVQPVLFHANGCIRSLPLERQTPVQTPAGIIPAELLTFHDNGTVHRVFPLNGRLTAYWTQEDEGGLAPLLAVDTPLGEVKARVINLCFDVQGRLRSITLWPGETVCVPTPVGKLEVRIGIAFHADGTLRSVEPAEPVSIPTPLGEIRAYDPDAVGINGDENSLCFGPNGELTQLATTMTRIEAVKGIETQVFAPHSRESLCGETEQEVVPMFVRFHTHEVEIRFQTPGPSLALSHDEWTIQARPCLPQLANPFGIMHCSV